MDEIQELLLDTDKPYITLSLIHAALYRLCRWLVRLLHAPGVPKQSPLSSKAIQWTLGYTVSFVTPLSQFTMTDMI